MLIIMEQIFYLTVKVAFVIVIVIKVNSIFFNQSPVCLFVFQALQFHKIHILKKKITPVRSLFAFTSTNWTIC